MALLLRQRISTGRTYAGVVAKAAAAANYVSGRGSMEISSKMTVEGHVSRFGYGTKESLGDISLTEQVSRESSARY